MKQIPINNAPKFLVSEILSHSFLQKDDVQVFFSHKLFDLGFPATPAKTPHIPASGSHCNTHEAARAWREGVEHRLVLGGSGGTEVFLFFFLAKEATVMDSGTSGLLETCKSPSIITTLCIHNLLAERSTASMTNGA
jgi:hypothetical protein